MSLRNTISVISIVSLFFVPLICELPSSSAETLLQSMNYPLEKTNASFRGAQYDAAGSAVRIVGDVNGDGKADLLIGAPGQYYNKNAGRAFLFFGRSSGWSADLNISTADVIFKAENTGDQVGFSVGAGGDVNGDGLSDILIGAPYNNDAGSATGKVYLILGRTSGWTHEMDLKNSSASFTGVGDKDQAGFYLDGAGDVNGDGLDDILIYAAVSNGNTKQSHAYLILGKKTGWTTGLSLSKASATISSTGYCHFPVAGVGDVNGDSYDDLLILGLDMKINLMLGSSSGWSGNSPLSGAAASFVLEDSDEQCPAVSKVGDVNGDSLNDILISSPLYVQGSNTSDKDKQGKVYLVFGKKTGWSKGAPLSKADASFVGAKGDVLGWAHSGGGDVNGDGLEDLAIMAGRIYGGERTETYLVLGAKSGWSRDVAIEKAATASYIMEANRSFSKSLSLSLAGDTNGDGMDDLLIGDPAGCEGETFDPSSCAGEVYLVLPFVGKPNNPPKVEPVGPTDAFEGKPVHIRVNATDLDKDLLTYSLVDAPSGATISDAGEIAYTPVASDYRPDPYNIKVVVSDGKTSSSISINLTVHFEVMALVAGPVLTSEGAPLEGAQVIMTVNGTPFTNTTGADGLAHFTVPRSMNGSKVDVDISKDGYTEKAFPANVDQTRGLVAQDGQYPKLSKKVDTKVNSALPLLVIMIVLAITSILIVLFHRSRRRILKI